MRRASLLELGVALLSVAAAAAVLQRFFAGVLWVAPLAGALVLGAGLTTLALHRSMRRGTPVPWPAVIGAAVVVLALYELFALHFRETRWGLPGPAAWRALADGVVSGWARMLSTALPADAAGDLLALPVAMLFVAGVVSAVLVLTTRALVAVAAPAVVVLVVGLVLVADRPGTAFLATGATLGVVVVLLLMRASRFSAVDDGIAEADAGAVGVDLAAQRRHSAAGRVLFGLPAAVVVVGIAVAGAVFGPLADGSDRVDPRDAVTPPVALRSDLSPLVQVRPQLTGAVTPLYEITVPSGQEPVTAVRVAALDGFDGALWTQTGEFVLAGSRLPTPDDVPAGAVDVRMDVVVLRSTSPYLPVVGVPREADGVDAAVEVASGSLIDADTDATSVAAATTETPDPLRYSLVGAVTPLAGVDTAGIPTDATRYTTLPDPPSWVRDVAQQATEGQTTPWLALQSLEKFLYDRPYSLQARPGESYGAVQRMLLSDDQFGYAEQHASAFAILARSLGYPARVAVGYRLDETTRQGDTYTVTTADAHAWPEVLLDGYGWVPFEPTNPTNDAGAPPPQSEDVAPLPDQPQAPRAATPDTSAEVGASPTTSLADRVSLVGLWAGLGLLALVAVYVALVVGGKALRRSRRRGGGPAATRISAAWSEVSDRLRESGFRVPTDETPSEVAARAGASPVGSAPAAAAPSLLELAVVVTSAVYAPDAPTAVAVRRAWELAGTASSTLSRRRPLPARVRSLLDPRPLLRRRERTAPGPRPAAGRARRRATTGRGA